MSTLKPEPLTKAEVIRLLDQPNKRCTTGLRNYAMLTTLYRAGLRCSEALGLLPKDVDIDRGQITVLHGKGDKRRVVGIDTAACDVLGRWMDKRSSVGLNGRQAMFCTLKGGKIATVYVRNLVRRLAKRAGIEKRVHPHGLRHTMAVEMHEEGMDIRVIQKQLGHENLRTTAEYLDHLKPQIAIEAVRNRSWESDATARRDIDNDRSLLDIRDSGDMSVLALLVGMLCGAQATTTTASVRG